MRKHSKACSVVILFDEPPAGELSSTAHEASRGCLLWWGVPYILVHRGRFGAPRAKVYSWIKINRWMVAMSVNASLLKAEDILNNLYVFLQLFQSTFQKYNFYHVSVRLLCHNSHLKYTELTAVLISPLEYQQIPLLQLVVMRSGDTLFLITITDIWRTDFQTELITLLSNFVIFQRFYALGITYDSLENLTRICGYVTGEVRNWIMLTLAG